MTIRKKIYSVIAITIFILTCIYILIQRSNHLVHSEVEKTINRDHQKSLVVALQQNTVKLNLLGMDNIVDREKGVDNERRAELDQLIKENHALFDELNHSSSDEAIKNALPELTAKRDALILANKELVHVIDEKKKDEAIYAELDDRIDELNVSQQAILDSISKTLIKASQEDKEALTHSLSKNNFIITLLFLFGILVLVVALFTLLKSILSSIHSFKNSLSEILEGDGDLSRSIVLKNKDEMTDLANIINSFLVTLKSLVSQVKDASVMISAQGDELNLSIHKVKDSSSYVVQSISHSSDESQKMNRKFEELSSTSFVIADNIQSVSAAIEELSASMNEIGRNAGQSTQVANTALQSTLRALETIQSLGAVAQNINSISDYISEIAEQTNLLSLNAAIEAAGAGEAGKGFAVVASEVKELAKQAQNASRNIIEQIRSVQEGATNAVQEVQSISNVMRDVNDFALSITAAVEEQSSVTRSISMNIQEVNSGSLDVKESIVRLTQGTERLNHNFSNVNEAIEKHEEQTQSAANTTQKLLDLAENLKTSVNRFNV